MGLDIVEIALDYFTDATQFEKLASEVMRNEGYPGIKPLGGVHDSGQDAVEDHLYIREGRTKVVFQYTMQENAWAKVVETIQKLEGAGIDYHQLVLVTSRSISSARQAELIRSARSQYSTELNIFERKTIVNRLSDLANGIFHRFFPDIEAQIRHLTTVNAEVLPSDPKSLERAFLRASLAFTFHPSADAARRSVFDNLILGLVLHNEEGVTIDQIQETLRSQLGSGGPASGQVQASLDRLDRRRLIEHTGSTYRPSNAAKTTNVGRISYADQATKALISDVADEVCKVYDKPVSEETRNRIERNARDALVALFRLMGIEIANQVLGNATAVYAENLPTLLDTAKRGLTPELGELLVAVIADVLRNPSPEQAEGLSGWSLGFLGVEVMRLDPNLSQFQATRLSQKIFVLDTDFILDCLVAECPLSQTYLKLVETLLELRCRVIIPESALAECTLHASIAYRTHDHFSATLLALSPAHVDEMVWNVFVKGYYYGRTSHVISPSVDFYKYIANYYEPTNGVGFMRDVVEDAFPPGVEFTDPSLLLEQEIPAKSLDALSDELLALMRLSRKWDYRTEEESRELARTDAKLFLSTLTLNLEGPGTALGQLLGGRSYIITASSKYLRSAARLAIKDVVTTRPQSLMAVLELVGYSQMTPSEFVSLFENPLLIHAVQQTWDDVRKLVDCGIDLSGKSLARLRFDLDQELHRRVAAVENTPSFQNRDRSEAAPTKEGAYLNLLDATRNRGYRLVPELKPYLKALERLEQERQQEVAGWEQRVQNLQREIDKFGKRRQKYLRRQLPRKNPE